MLGSATSGTKNAANESPWPPGRTSPTRVVTDQALRSQARRASRDDFAAVTYVPVSTDDRRTELLGRGVSEWFAELLLSLETSAEAGQIGAVTTTLKELLRYEPRTVEEFLIENAARFRS